MHEIEKNEDIRLFLHENRQEMLEESAHDFLSKKLHEKNMKISDVACKSKHTEYIYKVFAGTRRASRDILISIAFGLGLSADEAQMLLRLAGTARLDPRNRRDAITLYALLKGRDVIYLNELLYEIGEGLY